MIEAVATPEPAPAPPFLAAKIPAAATAEPTPPAKEEADPPAALPEPQIVSPLPPAPSADGLVAQTDSELVLQYGDRRYRVRGWNKPLNPEALKVNLLVSRPPLDNEAADAPRRPLREGFHVDSLDLYQAKARAVYVKQAGIELGEGEDVLKHDLGRILLHLEAIQAERLHAVLAVREQTPAMDPLQRADALAVLIQSSSAAGKSSLMDAVLALIPDEAQVRYSAMTCQSVFYLGETNLKHKILSIAEEEGAAHGHCALAEFMK